MILFVLKVQRWASPYYGIRYWKKFEHFSISTTSQALILTFKENDPPLALVVSPDVISSR